MKTKRKEKKNLLVGLILILALGFIGVGATDLSTAEDLTNHADNQAQAATPHLVTGAAATTTWTLTLENARQNDRNNRRRKKETNKALWKIAKDASKDIGDWAQTMTPSKSNRNPGTAEQKAAWKAFGLKTPFARATEVVEQLHFKIVEQGGADASVTSVLIEEFEVVLKRDTQRLADPTFKVAYLLHVCMNLGMAMTTVAKKNATQEMSKKNILDKLTVKPPQLKAAFDSEQVKALTNIKGYELVVRPYTIGKNKVGVTPDLNAEYYQAGNTPLKKAVKAQVEEIFDEKVWNPLKAKHEPSLEDSIATVKSWGKQMNDDMTAALMSDQWKDLLPDLQSLILQANTLVNTIQATKSKEMAKEHNANLKKLFNEFHEVNAEMQTANMPTREEILKREVDKQLKKEVKAIRSVEHSFEILMTRKEGKQSVATLLWHLSFMSKFKNKGNTFAENDHKGARFLLGPSNGVKIPDAIDKGYLNAIADSSAGYDGRLSGDAVSMQMIRKSHNPHFFGVKKDMKNPDVKKVMHRRRSNRHMYTMMNIALGADPKQLPHLVLGLYTDPKLVESAGQMTAEVLIKDLTRTSVKARPTIPGRSSPQKRKNRRKKTLGPNTKKNQAAVKRQQELEEEAEASLSASPEEVEAYMAKNAAEKKAAEQAKVDAEQERQARLRGELDAMTVKQLKDELKEAGLPVSGKKDDLKQRLIDNGWLN